MSNDKCFCHFNGYQVKDATARKDIKSIQSNLEIISNDSVTAYTNSLEAKESAQRAQIAAEEKAAEAETKAAAAEAKAAAAEAKALDATYNSNLANDAATAAEAKAAAAEAKAAAAENSAANVESFNSRITQNETDISNVINSLKNNKDKKKLREFNPMVPYSTELDADSVPDENLIRVPNILNYNLVLVVTNDGSIDSYVMCHVFRKNATEVHILGNGSKIVGDTANLYTTSSVHVNIYGWIDSADDKFVFTSNTSVDIWHQMPKNTNAEVVHNAYPLKIKAIYGII